MTDWSKLSDLEIDVLVAKLDPRPKPIAYRVEDEPTPQYSRDWHEALRVLHSWFNKDEEVAIATKNYKRPYWLIEASPREICEAMLETKGVTP